ncbi:hypothetical protein CHLRE_13g571100v5 [Chlamydomonas reinhardtii]|uniref:Uncharacterized protein n=1 Tax=Chlamydomonas reinhardtii TaxID=3055 RepID=A0A2K3CZN7_CHLRE|nr:uncharacterized protein CHLRE_13g571100v5 [Chlamydomonas reinhardtii]PNW73747.1 hypothetical protein CHLRE_13g571100v5 [Chlamydomonas reinhardtii]
MYYVHITESETRFKMKQGPKRDRERLEAATSKLFEQAMSDEMFERGAQVDAGVDDATLRPSSSR